MLLYSLREYFCPVWLEVRNHCTDGRVSLMSPFRSPSVTVCESSRYRPPSVRHPKPLISTFMTGSVKGANTRGLTHVQFGGRQRANTGKRKRATSCWTLECVLAKYNSCSSLASGSLTFVVISSPYVRLTVSARRTTGFKLKKKFCFLTCREKKSE